MSSYAPGLQRPSPRSQQLQNPSGTRRFPTKMHNFDTTCKETTGRLRELPEATSHHRHSTTYNSWLSLKSGKGKGEWHVGLLDVRAAHGELAHLRTAGHATASDVRRTFGELHHADITGSGSSSNAYKTCTRSIAPPAEHMRVSGKKF